MITSDIRFAIVPEWLIYHPDITPIALRTFTVMARLSDKDTDQLTEGRPGLARLVRCSPATLDRALGLLRRIGAVTWENRRDGRGLAPSEFTLHYTPPVTLPVLTSEDTPTVMDEEALPIEDLERGEQEEDPPPTPPTPPVIGTSDLAVLPVGACRQEGCDRGAGHRGPHRNPWFDAIGDALYPGEGVPEHQHTLAGKLASRARRAGHPPERIGVAAAWILREWGPAKLTLSSLNQHYERASGPLAQLTEEDRDAYLADRAARARRARLAAIGQAGSGAGTVVALPRKGSL